MSVVGLITEYNPFHNGHLYHIQEAKRVSGADTVVVVMSGNFVQRGTVAMIDKYTRTRMALMAGADIVIELPVCYATASAEFFALGAVSILDQLGFVDTIVFGSECGNVELLKEIAKLYENEPAAVTEEIQTLLRKGLTYPAARSTAMIQYLRENNLTSIDASIDIETILNSPNNILGIEYIKALHRLNSNIVPLTIQRIQAEFHSENLSGTINSATAIRKAVLSNRENFFEEIRLSLPDYAFELLQERYQITFPVDSDDVSMLLKYKLLSETADSLCSYQDVSKDLANRISKLKLSGHSFDDLVEEIKSKHYTQTRIQRAFIHILLNITKDSMQQYSNHNYTPYARILGLRKSASSYLRKTQKKEGFTIITKVSSASLSEPGLHMFQTDLAATHLYNLLIADKYGTECKDEYTHGMIIVE